jgi:colanic acid/amylovoran biosynthesis protein
VSRHVIISGVTSCDNRGVEALVRSIVAGLGTLGPWHATVLTQTPKQDAALLGLPNVTCAADPFVLSRSLRRVAPATDQGLATQREQLIASANLVIATGGDLHTNDYGVSTRYLTAPLAAQEQEVPVAMLAHSVGPFADRQDATAWSAVARRCAVVTTRESITWRYVVNDLGLPEPRVTLTADPAFLLDAAPGDRTDHLLADLDIQPGQPYVCLAPSSGIDGFRNLPDGQHTAALLNLINCLVARWRLPVLLVPHVHDSRPHNDDRRFVADLAHHVAHPDVRAVPGELTAAEYKAISARSVLTIAERMHAAIGALSCGVPTIAIGYSRKFVGILADTYGDNIPLDQIHLDVDSFVTDDKGGIRLVESIDLLNMRAALTAHLPRIKERARSNFTRLADVIEELA